MSVSLRTAETMNRFFKEHAYSQGDVHWQTMLNMFVDLFMTDDRLQVDDVREWAVDHEWPPQDIVAIGVLVDTIYFTLRRARALPRRHITTN